ncbi:MAG TPA: alkaline phosphatase family protein [Candidatus Tumulicola sp.]
MKKLWWLMAAALAACSSPFSQGTEPSVAGHSLGRHAGGSSPIQHVIIIMQENRTFNNLFYGFPGATTSGTGVGHGTTYTLVSRPLEEKTDLNHSHAQFLEDFDQGKSDGWDDEIIKYSKTGSVCGDKVNENNEPQCWIFSKTPKMEQLIFSYVQQSDIQPYWTMAKEYALGDEAFESNSGPTFNSHEYMIAGQAGHTVEVPDGPVWGCNAQNKSTTANLLDYGQANPPAFPATTGYEVAGPYPCFTFPTIADTLDHAGITWKFYAQKTGAGRNLNPFESISNVWNGPDHANIINPDTTILKDIKSGNLPQVSWVTPSGSNSDHPGPQSGPNGPSWVGSIVNAVGKSQYWGSTAIVVMWEEAGGWYDSVVPQQLADPQTGAYEGLGYRVPLIVISPYAKAGYVSHTHYEVASTLNLIEETFGLPTIGACTSSANTFADCRTTGFDDMFDFTQKPIKFKSIPTKQNAEYFLTHPDNTPPDTY